MLEAINLVEKLNSFDDHWAPRTVAEFNGNDIMVVKVQGEFNWHAHEDTDDFFLVIKGEIDVEMPNTTVTLKPGEIFIVPKGIEHRTVAKNEAHLLLIEPSGTPNTGNAATAAKRVLV